MLKLMLQFAFEQGGTDIQMYIHEWLQQWTEAAVKTKGHHHKFIGGFVTFIGVTTSIAK